MKFKKYNTSLVNLYNEDIHEGFGRLRNRVRYQDTRGDMCKINVPYSVREFVFRTGKYETNKDHSKAIGAIFSKKSKHGVTMVANIPSRILNSLESALGDEKVFNALMSGPVADLATLGMTSIECELINFGLKQLGEVLDIFYDFKSGADSRKGKLEKEIQQQRGGVTLSNVLSINQGVFILAAEEEAKINEVSRRLRIDKFKFKNLFASYDDPQHLGKINTSALHFENFFGEYYVNKNWDANKLQEDIDFLTSLIKQIRKSNRADVVEIYKTFINEIDIRVNQTNIKILEGLRLEADSIDNSAVLFQKKLLNMLFNSDVITEDSSFYGRIIYQLSNNRKLQNEFDRGIKSKIDILKRDIKVLIS